MVNLNFSSPSSTRLLEWSLSAFHTSLFFWLFAIVLYLTGSLGNLLASLNTIVGVIIFVFLWVTTWFCTRLVTRRTVTAPDWGATETPVAKTVVLATFAGGVNGLAFFLILLIVVAIPVALFSALAATLAVGGTTSLSELPSILVTAIPGFLIIGFFALAIGSPLSFVIGAVFGFIFGLLDLLLLAASQGLVALNAKPTKDQRRTTADEERMAEPQ